MIPAFAPAEGAGSAPPLESWGRKKDAIFTFSAANGYVAQPYRQPQRAREARMNIKEVKDLIHEVLQSDINEFELEHTGTRVRLKRGHSRDSMMVSPEPSQPASVSVALPRPSVAEAVKPSIESEEASGDSTLHVVTSPIVGTFYRAASPEAEPYVKLGDQVSEGTILCIVEAMKLMNEIPSDIDGEIVRIYIENAHPVEFGQKLFGIRPRGQG